MLHVSLMWWVFALKTLDIIDGNNLLWKDLEEIVSTLSTENFLKPNLKLHRRL
jgi:hypothetical protein